MIKLKIITNRKLCYGSDLLSRMERILDSYERGLYLKEYTLDSIILREKDLDEGEYFDLYLGLKSLVDKFNNSDRVKKGQIHSIGLYAHYFMEKSVEMGIKNIHLPLHIIENNVRLVDKFEKIGVSCHSLEEAQKAVDLGASYVTFSHIFVTDCKKGLEPRGLGQLGYIASCVDIPVYALGGIDFTNAESCIESGASGVVMMSNIMKE